MSKFWIYILECYKDKPYFLLPILKKRRLSCYYVGYTARTPKKRFEEHIENVKEKKYWKFTGRFDYVKLVWEKSVPTRAEALEIERHIKGFDHEQKRDLVNGDLDIHEDY